MHRHRGKQYKILRSRRPGPTSICAQMARENDDTAQDTSSLSTIHTPQRRSICPSLSELRFFRGAFTSCILKRTMLGRLTKADTGANLGDNTPSSLEHFESSEMVFKENRPAWRSRSFTEWLRLLAEDDNVGPLYKGQR